MLYGPKHLQFLLSNTASLSLNFLWLDRWVSAFIYSHMFQLSCVRVWTEECTDLKGVLVQENSPFGPISCLHLVHGVGNLSPWACRSPARPPWAHGQWPEIACTSKTEKKSGYSCSGGALGKPCCRNWISLRNARGGPWGGGWKAQIHPRCVSLRQCRPPRTQRLHLCFNCDSP